MSPSGNDDLNDLIKNMQKGQPNVPPPNATPPVMGGNFSMGNNPMASITKKVSGFVCCIGIIILVSTLLPFLLLGGFFLNGSWINDLPVIGNLMTQGTAPVSGDHTHYDPIANFADVQTYAGEDAQLLSMEANYVRSDGTMDLNETYNASANFKFVRELKKPPEDAPPIGAGGSADDKWYEPVRVDVYQPGQTRYMKRMGGDYNFEGNYIHQGMSKDVSSPVSKINDEIVDPPTCSFKDFWQVALKKGAPEEAVAAIEYDAEGYNFTINDVDVDLMFDKNCREITEE